MITAFPFLPLLLCPSHLQGNLERKREICIEWGAEKGESAVVVLLDAGNEFNSLRRRGRKATERIDAAGLEAD